MTSCIMGCPETNRVTRRVLTITSWAPEMATTPPVCADRSRAAGMVASTSSVASTPRPPAPTPAKAAISEALPRIAAGRYAKISREKAVRCGKAPAATGSSTQGVPTLLAPRMACRMPAYCSAEGVPGLMSTPDATLAKAADSSGVSHIAGVAPAASNTFAVTWVTTLLVRHCTSGRVFRMVSMAVISAVLVA